MKYKKVKKVTTDPVVLKTIIEKSTVTPLPPKEPEITETNKAKYLLKAKEFLENLKQNHKVIQRNQPLMLGIAKVLYELYPTTAHRTINTALYLHTHSKKYLNSLIKSTSRFDLNSTNIGPIDEVSKKQAKKFLFHLFKLTKERNKKH